MLSGSRYIKEKRVNMKLSRKHMSLYIHARLMCDEGKPSPKTFCLIQNLKSFAHIKLYTWNEREATAYFAALSSSHSLPHSSPISWGMNVWALLECLCIIQGNVRRDMLWALLSSSHGYKMIHSRGKNYFTWDGAWMFYERKNFYTRLEWKKIVVNPMELKNYVASYNWVNF
jgi:hypothetical protein